MSIPIAVKMYKNGIQQEHPERFMTVSYGTGYDGNKFYPKRITNQVLANLKQARIDGRIVPEIDEIQVFYNGMVITHTITDLIKVEGNVPLGVQLQ